MRNKRRLAWLIAGTCTAVLAVASLQPAQSPPGGSVPPARVAPGVESPPSNSRFAALPSRETIGQQRGEPFGPRSWAPPPRPVTAAPVPAAPPAPSAPPVPYRVAGQLVHEGATYAVLARDDRVFAVREGQALDGGYRVESIRPDGVTLVYTPLDAREHLAAVPALKLTAPVATIGASPPVASAAIRPAPAAPEQPAATRDARPAQLRWEGPDRVQAGSNFNVRLKLTSDQPVRASPLQLSFDSKLLEAVAVRPGGFFADGSFTYRVNPGGSIFVGAAGSKAIPADAEFLVVTFKPIRSGAIAELKLSSVLLQGTAGRAIAHEPLAAFRTSIVQ